jgi:hypothetical protein
LKNGGLSRRNLLSSILRSQYQNFSGFATFEKKTMHAFLLTLMLSLSSVWVVTGQDNNALTETEKEIFAVLAQQESNWNEGNIEGFMEGYWKSDSLQFIGKSGLTKGWLATMNGYKKSYPGKTGMGTLHFELLSMQQLSDASALVIGNYRLQRQEKLDKGIFSLVWRKINGKWLIVADHTSGQ